MRQQHQRERAANNIARIANSTCDSDDQKEKKGENSRALTKLGKVLAALVDAQLTIDKQQGINLIKPSSNLNK